MKRTLDLCAIAACALLAAGCGDDGRPPVEGGVLQTKAPGHVTAGGPTSGQAIAATGGAPTTEPSGTPGIPLGAGGNTGGTNLGAAMNPSAAAPPPAPAATEADKARQLAAAQDAVVAHWRSRAATQGNAPRTAPATAAASAPAIIRSEKLGTAPPSEDVKKATKPPTDPGVGARAPDAAN